MRLNALISLRFFAAFMIVAHHTKGHLGRDISFLDQIPMDQAVSFFFVLSGFIIMYVYPSINDNKSALRFILARIARLWPLHLLTGVLFVIAINGITILTIRPFSYMVIPDLLMFHSWIPVKSHYFSFNWASWAVATEFFFYLSFPYLAKNFARNWHIKLSLSFVLIVAISFVFNVWGQGSGKEILGISATDLLYINPLGRLFEFVLGMSFGHLFSIHAGKIKFSRLLGSIYEFVALALVIVSLLYSLRWATALSPIIGQGVIWYVHSGTSIFFGALIFIFAFGAGAFSQALSARALIMLGELSYSIYLLHQMVLRYFNDIKRVIHLDFLQGWSEYGFYLFIVFTGSYFLWRFVELPCRKIILKIGQSLPRKSLIEH